MLFIIYPIIFQMYSCVEIGECSLLKLILFLEHGLLKVTNSVW